MGMSSEQLENYNQIQIRLREMERQKKKDAKLSWNESDLLFQKIESNKAALKTLGGN